jgi:hypothetical protein
MRLDHVMEFVRGEAAVGVDFAAQRRLSGDALRYLGTIDASQARRIVERARPGGGPLTAGHLRTT